MPMPDIIICVVAIDTTITNARLLLLDARWQSG